jgi:cytochrome c-type biogenesis protein CcmF
MIADFGYTALLFAFAVAIYAVGAAWYGRRQNKPAWVESARNATILTFPLLALASGALIYLLVTGDFSINYVWQVSSRGMPTYLKVTALVGRPGRLAAFLEPAAGRFHRDRHGAQVAGR